MRALERKQKRVEAAAEDRRIDEITKKKAADAKKLLDEFE